MEGTRKRRRKRVGGSKEPGLALGMDETEREVAGRKRKKRKKKQKKKKKEKKKTDRRGGGRGSSWSYCLSGVVARGSADRGDIAQREGDRRGDGGCQRTRGRKGALAVEGTKHGCGSRSEVAEEEREKKKTKDKEVATRKDEGRKRPRDAKGRRSGSLAEVEAEDCRERGGGEGDEREARSWGRAALPRSCAEHFNRFHLRACERASECTRPGALPAFPTVLVFVFVFVFVFVVFVVVVVVV
ncbi:hypothetical protein G5I_13830 [Acromyrmex echinatior]|uniref:Uncharacterized protein n=1 Tax=Acromyrmex echinatior TaxID=103372 RepID=F4X634_ACREC|nr:hypothetical protein G5I_13830 [Acromyrmex echinatior]